jgi:hypothetical protein
VARDYNELKDELEEKNDEIQVLKEGLESAKGLIRSQGKRHNFISNYSKATTSRSGTRIRRFKPSN